jgi:catechol 2,3-dioxygenase-like lactoylglutathione lyase family enzyme
MAAKGIFYVFAFVSDLKRTKKFYEEILGWKLGTDEQGMAGYMFGSGYLIVHEDSRPAGSRSYGGGMHVEVMVEDATAEHARLKGLGLAVSELKDQPWGERNFNFSDPDGYLWSYGQDTSPPRK